jgi:hypothetical protein
MMRSCDKEEKKVPKGVGIMALKCRIIPSKSTANYLGLQTFGKLLEEGKQ